ncbi:MAG TPA: hypothetical protein VG733_07070 [Chthoniobacteraceae bacterium]|nr:hypothetical protein [Chthoniobacteraceae bacterium]
MNMRHSPKTFLLIAALALVFPGISRAQSRKSPTPAPMPAPVSSTLSYGPDLTVDKIVEKFFDYLAQGKVDDAYAFLTNGTKIGDDLKEMANLKTSTREAIEKFGDIKGSELVGIQPAGAHLLRATYVSLGAAYPLRWKFYFYRLEPGTAWKLIDIGVDDRLVDMFDDNKPPQQSQPAPVQ